MPAHRPTAAALVCAAFLMSTATSSTALAQANGIVDGRPATPAETWATVALVDPGSQEIFCTGTLIAPRAVLTAAHCVVDWFGWAVYPEDLNVVTAALIPEDAAPNEVHRVSRVEPHPSYGGAVWEAAGEWDIALLVLAEPVTTMNPAAVLPPERVETEMRLNRWLTLAGYGETSDGSVGVLQVAEAPLTRLWETEFVAGAVGTPDTCFGDSGGPVYLVDDRGGLYVVGVTSRAQDDATVPCGEGGVYTLAPAYTDWLAATSGGAFNPAAPPPLVADPAGDADDPPVPLEDQPVPSSDGEGLETPGTGDETPSDGPEIEPDFEEWPLPACTLRRPLGTGRASAGWPELGTLLGLLGLGTWSFARRRRASDPKTLS